MKNVQGILSLGNACIAVGDGPDGGALYQITDTDGDGTSDKLTRAGEVRGVIGEHGPHTVRLGPDGLLYVLCGNFAQVDADARSAEPVRRRTYEGD